MKLGQLPASRLAQLLSRDGLALLVPPFVFKIHSHDPALTDAFGTCYANYELAGPDPWIDFELAVSPQGWLRRWVQPLIRLELDGKTPFEPLPANQAFPFLEWGMNWCVTSSAHHLVMCHSAVLADTDRAVLLPAPPGSGKSTLSAALTLSGWRLLSDELALIDPETLALVPFVRPISLKNASITLIADRFPHAVLTRNVEDTTKGTISHLKAPYASVEAGARKARAHWIVLPSFQPHSQTLLTPLPKAEAVAELARNTFNLTALGLRCFKVLSGIVDQAACYRLVYSDLEEAIAAFDSLRVSPNRS